MEAMDLNEPVSKHFCFFIFNRATYSRIKVLIQRMSSSQYFKVSVVLSNSLLKEEYGNAQDYIKSSHENVSFHSLDVLHPGTTHFDSAMVASEILRKCTEFLSKNVFDAVVVIADRFETLPAAMAASYLNIPLIHIQGGEITGNIDEKVRHAVTKLSDYHLSATRLSKEYLVAMGEHVNRVSLVGCPSLDVVKSSGIKRYRDKKRYIVCIFHPETENTSEAYEQTRVVLSSITDFCYKNKAYCYWYWPNPDPGREEILKLLEEAHKKYPAILIKAVNKTPEAFLNQIAGCRFLVGNSSCLIREASYLGIPAINIGDRQRMRERSWNVVDVDYDIDKILKVMEEQDNVFRYGKSFLYGNGEASFHIMEILKRLQPTLKPSLQYPLRAEFKDKHFGESRFEHHHQGRQKKRRV